MTKAASSIPQASTPPNETVPMQRTQSQNAGNPYNQNMTQTAPTKTTAAAGRIGGGLQRAKTIREPTKNKAAVIVDMQDDQMDDLDLLEEDIEERDEQDMLLNDLED